MSVQAIGRGLTPATGLLTGGSAVAASRVMARWPSAVLAVAACVSLKGRGHYTASDALSLVVLPMSLPLVLRDRFARRLFFVAAVWGAAQFTSDIASHSPLGLTGATTPVLILTTFFMIVGFNRIYGTPIEDMVAALAAGGMVRAIVFEGALSAPHPWKFYFATSFAAVVFVVLRASGRRPLQLMTISAFLVAADYLGSFRSGMGILVVTLLLTARVTGRTPRGEERGQEHQRRLRTVVAMVGAVVVLYLGYPSLALSGVLGQRAENQQSEVVSAHANVLLYARPEILQAAYIALRHPLLGIGTKTVLSQNEFDSSLDFVQRSGVNLDKNETTFFEGPGGTGLVTHSMALDSVDHAGFLALPFWILLMVWSVKGISRARELPGTLSVLVPLLGLTTLWDVLFSPMSASYHISLGALLALLWKVLEDRRQDPGLPTSS